MDETALNTSIRKLQETTPYPFPGRWTFRRTTGGYSIRDANKRGAWIIDREERRARCTLS